ncbi:MAG: histone deacetylase [Thermoplasmata archaeon]|nr:histone deacetylase [Thermoplasmata archaeon]MCK5398078.1 histone deacetylase [Thermoplasmata archaeon]
MENKCAIVYNSNHIVHRSEMSSPENPTRILKIINFLQGRLKLFTRPDCELITEFSSASDEDLLRVHDSGYIDFIKNYCKKGGGFLGDSTYLATNTFKAAASSAGAVITANELVVTDKVNSSFALVRPPGHHASSDKFGGYCIFNNAAIAVRYLQENNLAQRILIVDIDAHAGNGTMRIFYEDPNVINLSVHRDPHDFYPHDGFIHQIGRGKGRGYNINVEVPEGSGDEEYLTILENIIRPVMRSYVPDYVMCLVGFDAHYTDNQSNLQLTSNGYYEFIKRLKAMNNDKLCVILEGGYNTAENVNLAHTIIYALLGESAPYDDTMDGLSHLVTQGVKTRSILENKLIELIDILDDYYDFKYDLYSTTTEMLND